MSTWNAMSFEGKDTILRVVCHEAEHETWTFTSHASAFDTLVKHGVDTDPECVSCHVVGFGQPGGFTAPAETPGLEDVGCESCHGRGGPHLSPDFVKAGDYSSACLTCHDTKHSLGFDYATFLPRVSHAANRSLLALSHEEKQRILAERGRPLMSSPSGVKSTLTTIDCPEPMRAGSPGCSPSDSSGSPLIATP